MAKDKISFTLDGVKYTDIAAYYWGNDKYSVRVAGTAQMIRQWMKQKYPEIPTRNYYWVQSESYSGGNSINVYLNDAPEELYKTLNRELNDKFEEGKFNGMDDSYSYTKSAEKSNEGMIIDYGAKYLFVNNAPPYGIKSEKVDWNNLKSANKTTTTTKSTSSSTARKPKFDRGTLEKESAGWELYRKDYGKNVLFTAVKKPETPQNKEQWNDIKSEVYLEAGYSYKFGTFQKYVASGVNVSKSEELCKVLTKYYDKSSVSQTASAPLTLPFSNECIITIGKEPNGDQPYFVIPDYGITYDKNKQPIEILYRLIVVDENGLEKLNMSDVRNQEFIIGLVKSFEKGDLKVLVKVGDTFENKKGEQFEIRGITDSVLFKSKVYNTNESETLPNFLYAVHLGIFKIKTATPQTAPAQQGKTKEQVDTIIRGLDVLIRMGNKQAEIKKKAYLIIKNRLS